MHTVTRLHFKGRLSVSLTIPIFLMVRKFGENYYDDYPVQITCNQCSRVFVFLSDY